MMIGGVCGARVSIVNAIAAVPQRVQQALLDFPRDQFPHCIVLQCRRSEMLNCGNLCLGKYHDLKNLFKGAAIVASSKPGPFREFYTALLTKGIRPEMARLTLARKIATIVLIVWKTGACFDAQHLKPQTA